MTEVHFMSEKTDWGTPQSLFDALNQEFCFTLDPCASHENAKVSTYFTKEDDGLLQSWDGHIVFMNPPFGRDIQKWMEKAYKENATVVCIVPVRTDTRWWHNYCMKADEVRLIDHRLKFVGSGNKAPFPTAIIVFKDRRNESPRLIPYGGR
jgi:phage N-6-adenine-methyltransferase